MKNILQNPSRFYVYAYLDPRKPGRYKYGKYKFDYEPFYIGKGSGKRVNCHDTSYELLNGNNTLKIRKIKQIMSDGLNVIKIKIVSNISEHQSLVTERQLIRAIGRTNLKTGCLTNLNDGGTGNGNRIVSDRVKKELSRRYKGRAMSDTWKIRIGINSARYWKNRPISKNVIKKIKSTKRRHPQNRSYQYRTYLLTSPNNKQYTIKDGLDKFCKKKGLSREHLVSVATGHRHHHKKWKCKIIDTKIAPKNRTYKLTNLLTQKEIVTTDIKDFATKNSLDTRRIYEVARGKRICHRGWKCEYLNPVNVSDVSTS